MTKINIKPTPILTTLLIIAISYASYLHGKLEVYSEMTCTKNICINNEDIILK